MKTTHEYLEQIEERLRRIEDALTNTEANEPLIPFRVLGELVVKGEDLVIALNRGKRNDNNADT